MAGQPAGWLAAPAEAMLALLAHLRRAHGGAEGYLRTTGVDPLTLERPARATGCCIHRDAD